jgi:hypothetical protein
MIHVREIKVRIVVETNKGTRVDQEYTPREDETLPELLRRIAEEYEERYGDE